MSSIINTNSLSLMTQNNLNASQSQLNTAIQRLSSGLRINSAKDDAAGQAIANRFTANINGLTVAQRNANDGISMAQTTEGALTEVNNNLQRIRTLAVQAANGSNSASDLKSIQDEITQRLAEIDRTSQQTDFNGVKVLSSSAKALNIQVGANDGQTISVNLSEISSKTLGLDSFSVTSTPNKAATVTDLSNAVTAGTATKISSSLYQVTTKNTFASTDQVLAKLQDGDTVAVAGGNTYTYNSSTGNFSYKVTTAASAASLSSSNLPAFGQAAGTYTNASGASVQFKVDSAGKLTAADGVTTLYDDGAGNLTTNNTGGLSQATLGGVFTNAGSAAAGVASVQVNGTTYTSAAGGNVTNNAAASKNDVAAAVLAGGSGNATTVTLGKTSGLTSTIKLDGATGKADGANGATSSYVDAKGNLTTTASFTTNYAVDTTTGAVTVADNSASPAAATDPDINAKIGGAAYIDAATNAFTTSTTSSSGSGTTDPLAVLDKALQTVDNLRSSLGAVQNRLDSVISNLGTTVTNLSSSRSRIQDADYATEVSNMTRANILQQAGTSVLAQANQSTQGVLSLLR
ncbi:MULTISPECIES: flagellin N-terminal helical domain-containing protein [unclassified Cupriavidus]|uniref:flagellin N-terminal helical domain-containing protein n=1 Tax=unclassified Cupriavidus TaxID=2640874 RepID=UPI003F91FF24